LQDFAKNKVQFKFVSMSDDWLNLQVQLQHGPDFASNLVNFIIQSFEVKDEENVRLNILKKLHGFNWTHIHRKTYNDAFLFLLEKEIHNITSGDYDKELFESLLEWLHQKLFPFIDTSMQNDDNEINIKKELYKSAVNLYTKYRSEELFEMVTDFPDSITALKELKELFLKSNNASYVGKKFRSTLQRRLLHIGASTSQILDFYISMIKAFRVVDSTDLLLTYAALPIRKYLKKRKDTIRCIVASLTKDYTDDPSPTDLKIELKNGKSLEFGIDEDDEENGPGENWEPKKREKDLTNSMSYSNRSGLDVLAILVSIYGSTDLFIVEYRNILADKLLLNFTYFTDNEVANLELLKLRFFL
jgi:anaphase-promoting complex subunit 2